MKPLWRKRAAFIWLIPLMVIAALLWTDPDRGSSTSFWVLKILTASALISVAHWWDKGIFDYEEADRQRLFRMARGTPSGAGLALIARALTFVGLFLGIVWLVTGSAQAQDVRSYVPPACVQNLQLLAPAQRAHWPDHPDPAMLPALIEHESCISLQHSRCCNPGSRLKTSREEGAGLGQITRTWRPDGSLRFDALAELRELHPALRAVSWENVYQRADLQNDAVVLKSRDNFRFFVRFVEPAQALLFADAGYNQGNGRTQQDRRACAVRDGCDPDRWFGHVERTCTASHRALYAGRSPCQISRDHVHDVAQVRAPKYRGLL